MTNLNLNYKYQSGMATMLMSLVMVMTISMVSIYGAQVSVVEQKISSSHYRSKQAFEAAQAGLEATIFTLTPDILNNLIAPAGGAITIGTENDLPIDPAQAASYSVASGNGHYQINFSRNAGNSKRVDITSFGFSGDNASLVSTNADQIIHQSIELVPIINSQPPANIVSLGSIDLGKKVSITNTSGANLAATWSGGSTTVNASSINVTQNGGSGTYSNDGNLQGLASSASTAEINAGLKNITQNNQFFENFFSESKARLKARSTVINCQAAGCNTNDLKSQLSFDANNNLLDHVIWVDAYDEGSDKVRTLNLDKNFSLGTASNPVILIVEGKIKLNNSNANINGVVYTTQSFKNGKGKGRVTGSLISEGDISATGSMKFVYDNDVTMTNALNSSGTTRYTRVAGTWRDFN